MLRRLLESIGLRRPSGARSARRASAPPRHGEPSAPPSTDAARVWTGPISFSYAPEDDDKPDPGEVVWTWVPYEENPGQGKDRPVVVMGWAGPGLLGVIPLTSKDHSRDPNWLAIGTGGWDPQERPSWVRLNFVLAVPPHAVRREGSSLDRARFELIAKALRSRHGWH